MNFAKFSSPGSMMSQHTMPRPTKGGGVIGPLRIQMDEKGGDAMRRMSSYMPKTSLSPKLKPMTRVPTPSVHMPSASNSLISTMSNPKSSGLSGIKRM